MNTEDKALNWLSRSELLYGSENMQIITKSRVAVFGVGGVGGYAVEALARLGVCKLDIIDGDVFEETNINRQLLATCLNIGQKKTAAAKERIKAINPLCSITEHPVFYSAETENELDYTNFDCIIDAVDDVQAKLLIIKKAKENNIPIVSAMGAGNKTDASLFRVDDIFKTSGCPLAKTMRRELSQMGISSLQVVFSPEPPAIKGVSVIPSNPISPAVCGLLLTQEAIRLIIAKNA